MPDFPLCSSCLCEKHDKHHLRRKAVHRTASVTGITMTKQLEKKADTRSIIKKCPKGYRYYATGILTQCRVTINGKNNKIRPCSIEVCLLMAKSDRDALRLAKKRGKSKEVSYENSDGNMVHVEFIGITHLNDITFETQFDEICIWSGDLLNPMERKAILTMSDEKLIEQLKNNR